MTDVRPGWFGEYGGQYVAETLVAALHGLEGEYHRLIGTDGFEREFKRLLTDYVGRPTALTHAAALSERAGAEVWLKREDLCHTGAHKINNTIGQVLLAKAMGKERVIAETGAGQHGVATATACALMGVNCEVFMGAEDVVRQAPNVARMRLLGAKVRAVESGSKTLKDAMNEALRFWVTHVSDTYYCVGSAAGPHPYPTIVSEFQSIIGREAKAQCLSRSGALPDAVVACVGGGSNAIGIFQDFLEDDVRLYGVEAAGTSIASGLHAAPLTAGRVGVLHGMKTYVLSDVNGQIQEAHSVSAGLDYPGVGPQHAYLRDSGRVTYHAVTDEEAVSAYHFMAREEGIVTALETCHAIAFVAKYAREQLSGAARILLCLSGRGDKDAANVARFEDSQSDP